MSHFYAYMARMKLIQRWGLMRNTCPENIQEHSLQVAMIAHGLAVTRNKHFGGRVSPERVLSLAVYHEVGEIITGDLATPIKNFNPEIKKVFREIEEVAKNRLVNMLPDGFSDELKPLIFPEEEDFEHWQLVKAADKICAYLKCLEELKAGNQEFLLAKESIARDIGRFNLPEVTYFMETFVPSFSLTLDEME